MLEFRALGNYFIRKIKYNIRNIQYREIRNLKDFKDIHKNKRCFIIGTGPSLTIEDIEKIRNEYTFSCNSITKVFDKTTWRPTYYGIIDRDVYFNLDKSQLKMLNCVFYSAQFIYPYDNGHKIYADNSFYHIHFTELLYKHPHIFSWTKFSSDISKRLYDGRTVVYVLIQIAVYMGFNEIYLLGCDTNYTKNNMYSDLINSKIKFEQKHQYTALAMIECYKVAKKFADAHDIKIFNVTRGGMLEVFPRKTLEEVLLNEAKYENI